MQKAFFRPEGVKKHRLVQDGVIVSSLAAGRDFFCKKSNQKNFSFFLFETVKKAFLFLAYRCAVVNIILRLVGKRTVKLPE